MVKDDTQSTKEVSARQGAEDIKIINAKVIETSLFIINHSLYVITHSFCHTITPRSSQNTIM